MACTLPRRSANSFAVLDSPLDPGLTQCHPAKSATPTVASKHRQFSNPQKRYNNPHKNGNYKPGFTEAARTQNNHQRFPNKPPVQPTVCNLPPRLCPPATDPCHTPVPCSQNDLLNTQLRQFLLAELQKPTRPEVVPVSTTQPMPICNPTMSEKRNPQSVAVPSQSSQSTLDRDNILSSTPAQHTVAGPPEGHTNRVNTLPEQRPCTPEVVSCTPTNANTLTDSSQKPTVSLPHPPGLPKPRRGMKSNRARGSMKSVTGDACHNEVVDESSLQNGLEATNRVLSPPPPVSAPSVVRLPLNKGTQPAPRSPSTTASSLSEDTSMWSSVPVSDTSFTSVGSQSSSMVSKRHAVPREICRNWLRGRPCARIPCRFLHSRRDQPPDPSPTMPPMQPRSTPPSSSCSVKGSVHSRYREAHTTDHDPPCRDAEPPQKHEFLYSTTISDHIKVRFDQGFEVRDVMTGFESRWVHLGNISTVVTSADMDELLRPYKVDSINVPESSGKTVTVKVQFASTEDAIKAVTNLNGIEFAKRTITAKLSINNSSRGGTVLADTDVQLVWESPFRVGYAGYDTLKEAKAALESLNGAQLDYLVVSAQLYEGLPCVSAYNVILERIPANITAQSLRKFTNAKAVMLGHPNYESLDRATKSIRSRLEEYGTLTSFDVLPPPYRDGMVKAWARFTSPAEAREAQGDLDHRRPKVIGHTTLSCRHVVSVSHGLSAAIYNKIRGDIGLLRLSWQRRYGPSVSIREKSKENDEGGPTYIRLSSEHPELLSTLKYEYEQLLHGETVTLERKPLWDDFLIAPAGRTYIAQMQAQYPGVQIEVHGNRRVISLWGPMMMRQRARQEIVRKIVELKAQQFWKIPLSGKLLGIFCSSEFSALQGLLGSDNCIMDFGERVLVVRGNDSAFRTACDVIQDLQSRQGDVAHSSENVCPVCFGEAVVPMSLACGHQWCRSCLTSYLTSAVENKMFPLKCLGEDATCTQCVPLGLSRKLLSATDFNAVIEAAFWGYVHSRPDEFHHCPTPDCPQVYRSAPPNSVLQCPSCLVRICPACRIQYHDGMTCEERDVAEDKLLQEWTSNHDVKSCPGCKALIERSEGCNHMTCTRCQTHICWECLQTFPKGQGIYDHMRYQHGSIGL